ncbi:MAG TPA: radical SAM protein [Candidatus Ozemobacteraceae bacterium]|nr:radical SAM protein [Candidatus Ozemobacteraceae bacterium]
MNPGPETLHLDITNGCNTSCVTCWDHSPLLTTPRDPAWKSRQADPEGLVRIVSEAAALGCLRNVIVSGMGDPLTHPRALYLLSELKALHLRVTLISNMLAPSAAELPPSFADTILVGIHAADADGYRAFHPSGPENGWETLMNRLSARRRDGCHDRHVQVICALNAPQLVPMIELADTFRAERVNFKLASLARETEAVRITDEQRRRLLAEWIPAAAERADRLCVRHNLATLRAQVEAGGAATAPIASVGCHMGDRYARIAVDGTVYYCCNTETAIGRLSDGQGFSELWRGQDWNGMRARLARGEYFPGCARCGKFEQNAKIAVKLRAAGASR